MAGPCFALIEWFRCCIATPAIRVHPSRRQFDSGWRLSIWLRFSRCINLLARLKPQWLLWYQYKLQNIPIFGSRIQMALIACPAISWQSLVHNSQRAELMSGQPTVVFVCRAIALGSIPWSRTIPDLVDLGIQQAYFLENIPYINNASTLINHPGWNSWRFLLLNLCSCRLICHSLIALKSVSFLASAWISNYIFFHLNHNYSQLR